MARRPLVAVSGSIEKDESRSFLNSDYFLALHYVGLTPVLLSPHMENEERGELLARVDGLFFAGGNDLDPRLYGEPPHLRLGQLEPLRDRCECALIREAYERQVPVLGVCRGIQSMNVALGGSLYQDLPSQYPGTPDKPSYLHSQTLLGKYPSHLVTAVEGTPLDAILPQRELWVNSFHHQAVKEPAPSLAPCAYASDGLIEAVYAPGHAFFLGVQWHPERMYRADEASLRLFSAFGDACRAHGKREACV